MRSRYDSFTDGYMGPRAILLKHCCRSTATKGVLSLCETLNWGEAWNRNTLSISTPSLVKGTSELNISVNPSSRGGGIGEHVARCSSCTAHGS